MSPRVLDFFLIGSCWCNFFDTITNFGNGNESFHVVGHAIALASYIACSDKVASGQKVTCPFAIACMVEPLPCGELQRISERVWHALITFTTMAWMKWLCLNYFLVMLGSVLALAATWHVPTRLVTIQKISPCFPMSSLLA